MEQSNTFDMDFDLPEVNEATPSQPRIHIAGDVCISCEG
jgi:hypothetical protein